MKLIGSLINSPPTSPPIHPYQNAIHPPQEQGGRGREQLWLIPCGPEKQPLTPNGERNASNSKKQIRAWAAKFKGCCWGIATGPSGLIAVDEDCYKSLYVPGSLERACGLKEFPKTVEWRSGHGGRVRLFKRPGGGPSVTTKIALLPAIDVKANSGYVLAPPSVNAEGGKYEWVNSPKTTPIADAPEELVALIRSSEKGRGSSFDKPIRLAPGSAANHEVFLQAGDGRYPWICRIGGLRRREGAGEQALLECLTSIVKHHCEYDETLRSSEIERIVRFLIKCPIGPEIQLEMSLNNTPRAPKLKP